MAKFTARDYEKTIALLRASLGDINLKEPLKRLFEKAPQCGPFEWMLAILAIEIDLRVDVPEELADARQLTAEQFAKKVVQLPRLSSDTYTLDCLGLVAQALLHLEPESSESTTTKRKASRAKAGSKTKKAAPQGKPAASKAKKAASSGKPAASKAKKVAARPQKQLAKKSAK
jgi:hypothetical protein